MCFEWNESSKNVRPRNFRIRDLEPDAANERRALEFWERVEVGNFFVINEFVFLLGVVQLAVDHVAAERQAVGKQTFVDLQQNKRKPVFGCY